MKYRSRHNQKEKATTTNERAKTKICTLARRRVRACTHGLLPKALSLSKQAGRQAEQAREEKQDRYVGYARVV